MSELPSTNLIEYFKTYPLAISRRGKVTVDDFTLSGNGLPKKIFNRFFKDDRKALNTVKKDLAFKSEAEICEEISNVLPVVLDTLDSIVREGLVEQASNGIELETNLQMYLDAIPIIDMGDPRGGALMFHRDTIRKLPIEEAAWIRVMGKERVEIATAKKRAGRFEYNPRSIEPVREVNEYGSVESMFNKYNPPIHRVSRNKNAQIDPKFIEFLETFFEDGCREYAYNWIYYSTFNKLETYLTLVGPGGTGKNLLAEAIKYLHGVSNFRKAPPSCLYKEFNSHLIDTTMVFYDECKFSGSDSKGSGKNRLKEWANANIPVESKGKDAKNIDTFCSGIIATNNDSDVHLDQLDRKFSVMEITGDRLVDRLGEEESTRLWKYITDLDFPDAWLNFLETKIDPDFDLHKEYRGPRLDELIVSSLPNWTREMFFDYLLTGDREEYPLPELRENIPNFPAKVKLEDALRSYRPEGEIVGEVVRVNNNKAIRVIEKYRPKVEKGNL